MARAVYAIVDDEKLESEISESVSKLKADLFVINDINGLNEIVKQRIPKLIIIDLISDNIAVEAILEVIRSINRFKYSFILGITPIVDTNSMSKFVASKCNMVVTKRKFLREIDQLIKRNL